MGANDYHKANREYCISRGLCVNCYGKRYAMPNHQMCEVCAKKRRDSANERTAKFKAMGLCPYCKEHRPVIEGTGYCAECKKRQFENQRRRRVRNE